MAYTELESEISNMICGAGGCECPGDENGADTDKAMCWLVARKILSMSREDRERLARFILTPRVVS